MLFLEANRYQCKTYLVACEEAQQAILIDPNQDFIDRYLALLAYYQLTLAYVVDTHTHADHRSGCADLKSLTNCEIIRHELAPQPSADRYINDGEIINIGNIEIKVLHTPGHTLDSVSFYIDGYVITGDVLLIGGTGRTDFTDGNPGMQYDSITQKLFDLPDDTLVFPGHDYRGHKYSTIGHEKKTNPRIANRSRDEYIEIMNNLNLQLPKRIQEVLVTNITEDEDNDVALPAMTALTSVRRISADELAESLRHESAPIVVDVRTREEFRGDLGHIPNSIHVPLQRLVERSSELDPYRKQQLIVVCRAGVRSVTAAAILTGLGFESVYDLKGGMVTWNQKNLPTETT